MLGKGAPGDQPLQEPRWWQSGSVTQICITKQQWVNRNLCIKTCQPDQATNTKIEWRNYANVLKQILRIVYFLFQIYGKICRDKHISHPTTNLFIVGFRLYGCWWAKCDLGFLTKTYSKRVVDSLYIVALHVWYPWGATRTRFQNALHDILF